MVCIKKTCMCVCYHMLGATHTQTCINSQRSHAHPGFDNKYIYGECCIR